MIVNKPACAVSLLSLAVLLAVGEVAAQRPPRARPEGGGGRNLRHPDVLKLGDFAPDFTLKTLKGDAEVTLSDFKADRPVALVFGSYT